MYVGLKISQWHETCATVTCAQCWPPGVSLCVPRLLARSKHYKYYSVISSSQQEWVLFNCAQVLPCYVIEVRFDRSAKVDPIQPLPLQSVHEDKEEESETERKKRLLARVGAWFWFRLSVASLQGREWRDNFMVIIF